MVFFGNLLPPSLSLSVHMVYEFRLGAKELVLGPFYYILYILMYWATCITIHFRTKEERQKKMTASLVMAGHFPSHYVFMV